MSPSVSKGTESGTTQSPSAAPTAASTAVPGRPTGSSPAPAVAPPAAPSVSADATEAISIPVHSPEASENPADQPPLLSRLADNMGLSLEETAFGQIILAAATGSDVKIYCYDKNEDAIWILQYSYDGHLGQNGVTTDKREGDKCTPAGLFKIGFAFGNKPEPETEMEYRQVTDDVYWVDDPSSAYYNQWVEGTEGKDWNSAEHLFEYKNSYAYAVVVEYNYHPNTAAGKGSAIFLHCGSRTYYGCIAVIEDDMLEILGWLSPREEPHILITER